MKYILTVFAFFCLTFALSQIDCESDFLIINKTKRPLKVVELRYDLDSTIQEYYYLMDSLESKVIRGEFGYAGKTLRYDCIAIDRISKDTLFRKSYNFDQIPKYKFTIEIIAGQKEKLPDLFFSTPRLMVISQERKKIIKYGDNVSVRAKRHGKVKGKVVAYDNEKIVLQENPGKSTIVMLKEILAFKECELHLNFLGWIKYKCKYEKQHNLFGKLVTQKKILKDQSEQAFKWEWQEF